MTPFAKRTLFSCRSASADFFLRLPVDLAAGFFALPDLFAAVFFRAAPEAELLPFFLADGFFAVFLSAKFYAPPFTFVPRLSKVQRLLCEQICSRRQLDDADENDNKSYGSSVEDENKHLVRGKKPLEKLDR